MEVEHACHATNNCDEETASRKLNVRERIQKIKDRIVDRGLFNARMYDVLIHDYYLPATANVGDLCYLSF